jgi:hypothetical protein
VDFRLESEEAAEEQRRAETADVQSSSAAVDENARGLW